MCSGSFAAFCLSSSMVSGESKVHTSRCELTLGLWLFRSTTEVGVSLAMSLQLNFIGLRMDSRKILGGRRFRVFGDLFRFVKTSWLADFSSFACQYISSLFCSWEWEIFWSISWEVGWAFLGFFGFFPL